MDGTPVDSNWVEGYGVCMGKGDFSVIYSGDHVEKFPVYTDTVGQYTGLLDKNGKRIFEGDICRNTRTGEIVSVKWHGTMAGFVWSKRKGKEHLYDFGELFRAHDNYEVIGNIYDNPELVEVNNNG